MVILCPFSVKTYLSRQTSTLQNLGLYCIKIEMCDHVKSEVAVTKYVHVHLRATIIYSNHMDITSKIYSIYYTSITCHLGVYSIKWLRQGQFSGWDVEGGEVSLSHVRKKEHNLWPVWHQMLKEDRGDKPKIRVKQTARKRSTSILGRS